MNMLFSYGTLQDKSVQISTYGRELSGQADTLLGYRMGQVKISDAEVIRKSGTDIHPVAVATDNTKDEIPGTVFELTDEELSASDEYEVDEYERVSTTLKSGLISWVYVLKGG